LESINLDDSNSPRFQTINRDDDYSPIQLKHQQIDNTMNHREILE